jgi:hypothetical protein
LFFAESADTSWPSNPGEYTAFATEYAAARAIDLTREPLSADRAVWTHRTDYKPCLELADSARAASVEAIRYESVRDLQARANIALLTCRLFTHYDFVDRQTWHLHFGNTGVRAVREFPVETIHFDQDAFAADPRVTSMQWNRN